MQHWDVFKYVTEVFILVPALLGLKGNLEMTLASRLSTAVSIQGVEGGSGIPGLGRGGKAYVCVVAEQTKISQSVTTETRAWSLACWEGVFIPLD